MNPEYYIVDFILDNNNIFCIYTYPKDSEKDIFVSQDKKIYTFNSLDLVISYANSNKLNLFRNNEDSIYDVNKLRFLLSNLHTDFNCSEVLNFWNITDAICNTVQIGFLGNCKKYDDIYDKLFRGYNTASNAYEYHSKWNTKELKKIQRVLKECFSLINKYIF